MSHTVRIVPRLHDAAAITAATVRLHLPRPEVGDYPFEDRTLPGVAVWLPSWPSPVVCCPDLGELMCDVDEQRDSVELARFVQAYAIEKVRIESRRLGAAVCEEPLPGGAVRLAIFWKTFLQRLELAIAPDGTIEGRTHGFIGRECLETRRLLLQPLGVTTAERLTSDFYQRSAPIDQPCFDDAEPLELVVAASGHVRVLYAESFPFDALGPPVMERASHVNLDDAGQWFADLAPVEGPRLGPFRRRSEALAAEGCWLRDNWLHGD